MNRLQRRYARLAHLRDKRVRRGRHKAAARLRAQLARVRARLRQGPDAGRAAFAALLRHKRPAVRKEAACDYLAFDRDAATAALRALAARADGSTTAFSASTTLMLLGADLLGDRLRERPETAAS